MIGEKNILTNQVTPQSYLLMRLVVELRPWREEQPNQFESFLNEAYAARVAKKIEGKVF